LENMIGWIATSITIVYTALGLPSQIKKVITNKSTHGLSLFMTIMMFLTFTSWIFYAVVKSDLFILVPNTIGALCTIVLLILFRKYRDG